MLRAVPLDVIGIGKQRLKRSGASQILAEIPSLAVNAHARPQLKKHRLVQ